jgi:outer membrane protein TolC
VRLPLPAVLSAFLLALIPVSTSCGGELSFSEAVDRVERLNESLEAAREEEKRHESEVEAAKGLRWPQVEFNAREMVLDAPVKIRIGNVPFSYPVKDGVFTEAQIEGVWPLYTGGKIDAANRAAEARLEDSRAETRRTRHNLITELARRYFGLQLAQHALEVQRQKTEAMDNHAWRAERLVEEGIIARVEMLNARVALKNAERELNALERDIRIVTEGLRNIMAGDGSVELTTPLFTLDDLETLETYQGYVNDSHPVMQLFAAKQDLAQQGVRVEKSAYFPTLYLFAMKELLEDDLTILDPEAAAGIGLHYTVFNGRQRKHKVAAAESRKRKVMLLARKYRRDLRSLVLKNYQEMQKALEQFQSLETTLELAEENLRVRSRAFEEGFATSVEVVDANVSLARARLGRYKAACDYDTALFQLLEASGRSRFWQDYLSRSKPVMEKSSP